MAIEFNKAGGASVPLDSSHPETRHQGIVEQTKPEIIFYSPKQASRAQSSHAKVIQVSAEPDVQSLLEYSFNTHGPLPKIKLYHLIYYLFTSDSTGKPKGMIITHGGVSTASVTIHKPVAYENLAIRANLQFAAYVFDLYILEKYCCLYVQYPRPCSIR